MYLSNDYDNAARASNQVHTFIRVTTYSTRNKRALRPRSFIPNEYAKSGGCALGVL